MSPRSHSIADLLEQKATENLPAAMPGLSPRGGASSNAQVKAREQLARSCPMLLPARPGPCWAKAKLSPSCRVAASSSWQGARDKGYTKLKKA